MSHLNFIDKIAAWICGKLCNEEELGNTLVANISSDELLVEVLSIDKESIYNETNYKLLHIDQCFEVGLRLITKDQQVLDVLLALAMVLPERCSKYWMLFYVSIPNCVFFLCIHFKTYPIRYTNYFLQNTTTKSKQLLKQLVKCCIFKNDLQWLACKILSSCCVPSLNESKEINFFIREEIQVILNQTEYKLTDLTTMKYWIDILTNFHIDINFNKHIIPNEFAANEIKQFIKENNDVKEGLNIQYFNIISITSSKNTKLINQHFQDDHPCFIDILPKVLIIWIAQEKNNYLPLFFNLNNLQGYNSVIENSLTMLFNTDKKDITFHSSVFSTKIEAIKKISISLTFPSIESFKIMKSNLEDAANLKHLKACSTKEKLVVRCKEREVKLFPLKQVSQTPEVQNEDTPVNAKLSSPASLPLQLRYQRKRRVVSSDISDWAVDSNDPNTSTTINVDLKRKRINESKQQIHSQIEESNVLPRTRRFSRIQSSSHISESEFSDEVDKVTANTSIIQQNRGDTTYKFISDGMSSLSNGIISKLRNMENDMKLKEMELKQEVEFKLLQIKSNNETILKKLLKSIENIDEFLK
ncbi:hypothetical protein CAAN3_16S00474 [[Candida] anglica]